MCDAAAAAARQDTVHTLVYAGLLEELVEILEMSEKDLVEIKAAALRTLTSITHLERTPNLPKCVHSRHGHPPDRPGGGG